MNATNRTTLSLQVNAIFGSGLNTKIKTLEATPYQVGLFAEQDYRACVSMLYTIRMDLVRMQDGKDIPLQDIPKVGSLEANDTGRESEQDIERRALMFQASRAHAVIERHIESLAKQAQCDLEEAGQLTKSGGRYVLSSSTRSFRAYCGSWTDFLLDLKQNAKEGTPWMLKIQRAEELVSFPLVSAQDATDEFMDYFEDANILKCSHRAWEKVMERLELLGQTMAEHTELTASFNALPKEAHEAAKSEFAIACREHKQAVRNHMWWLERFLEPWALLAATGAPADLIDSPEWRTKEAELRAANARVKLAEVNAEMLELEALNAEAEARIALQKARARMAELSRYNEELHEAAQPRSKAPAPAPVSAPKEQALPTPAPKAEAKPAAPLTAGIKSHTTRGRASSVTGPRG